MHLCTFYRACSTILGWVEHLRLSRTFGWPLRPSRSKSHASGKCRKLVFSSVWVWLLVSLKLGVENSHLVTLEVELPWPSGWQPQFTRELWRFLVALLRFCFCWKQRDTNDMLIGHSKSFFCSVFSPNLDCQMIHYPDCPRGRSRLDFFGSTVVIRLQFPVLP